MDTRRRYKLFFWPVVLEVRAEFLGRKALVDSCIYGRPRDRGKGACVSEKMTGCEVR